MTDLAQHLVLHLHEIARVEEGAALEVRGTHPLGVPVERTGLLQAICLGVAPGLGGHVCGGLLCNRIYAVI
ncbi:MAG TPA: hypothetical protein PLO07_10100 [Rubrivivax sp.]|nr:hypothetical protein [Rubrivivax sp.]